MSSSRSQACSVRIIVTAARPGFHAWPGAPESHRYLASRHRHLFTFRVEFEVGHDDRDLEFHNELSRLQAWLDTRPASPDGIEWDARSCEAVARLVGGAMPHATAVEVWEDGEHGARVEFGA